MSNLHRVDCCQCSKYTNSFLVEPIDFHVGTTCTALFVRDVRTIYNAMPVCLHSSKTACTVSDCSDDARGRSAFTVCHVPLLQRGRKVSQAQGPAPEDPQKQIDDGTGNPNHSPYHGYHSCT